MRNLEKANEVMQFHAGRRGTKQQLLINPVTVSTPINTFSK
jgi:hypothetical protein